MNTLKFITLTLVLISFSALADYSEDKSWEHEISNWRISEAEAIAIINKKHGKYKHKTSNPSKHTYSWVMKRPYLKLTNRCLELTLYINATTGITNGAGIVYNSKCEKIMKKYKFIEFNKN